MNIHKNVRLTPLRRGEMALAVIEDGLSKVQAARIYGVSAKIVARWVESYKANARRRPSSSEGNGRGTAASSPPAR